MNKSEEWCYDAGLLLGTALGTVFGLLGWWPASVGGVLAILLRRFWEARNDD